MRAQQEIEDAGGLIAVLENGHQDRTVEIDARREAADEIRRLRAALYGSVQPGTAIEEAILAAWKAFDDNLVIVRSPSGTRPDRLETRDTREVLRTGTFGGCVEIAQRLTVRHLIALFIRPSDNGRAEAEAARSASQAAVRIRLALVPFLRELMALYSREAEAHYFGRLFLGTDAKANEVIARMDVKIAELLRSGTNPAAPPDHGAIVTKTL